MTGRWIRHFYQFSGFCRITIRASSPMCPTSSPICPTSSPICTRKVRPRTMLGQARTTLGQTRTTLRQARTTLGQTRTTLGQARTTLRQARTSRTSRTQSTENRITIVASLNMIPPGISRRETIVVMCWMHFLACVHNTRKVIPLMSDVQTDQYFWSIFLHPQPSVRRF
jgi:hypothetical protein